MQSLKMVLFLTPLIFLFSSAKAAATPLAKKYCRKNDGPSRCVDSPLMAEDEDLWCPYHFCAPNYVPAEECPTEPDLQATHKCSVKTESIDLHRCLEGRIHKYMKLPIGCEKTNSCSSETRVCACVKFSPTRDVLHPEFSISPIC